MCSHWVDREVEDLGQTSGHLEDPLGVDRRRWCSGRLVDLLVVRSWWVMVMSVWSGGNGDNGLIFSRCVR